jgi:hypothetical protein
VSPSLTSLASPTSTRHLSPRRAGRAASAKPSECFLTKQAPHARLRSSKPTIAASPTTTTFVPPRQVHVVSGARGSHKGAPCPPRQGADKDRSVTRRHTNKLHHIGLGRALKGIRIVALVAP